MTKEKFDFSKFAKTYMLEIILFTICVIIALTTKGFLTTANFLNILRNISLKGVIAFGMTMVIVAGEIDLSIASTVALSGVITALTAGFLNKSYNMPLETGVIFGILISFFVASLSGLLTGTIRTKFKIPTFIITLAMLNLLYGITAIISKGFPVTTLPEGYMFLGAGQVMGIPVPAIILMIVFAISHIIMKYTVFGRSVYAVGGNPESARLSGINVNKIKIAVMIIVQLMACLAGIMLSSQVMSGSSTFGKGWEMDVIASVIIGGASLNGGVGKIWGTFLGLIFLGILLNAMVLMNVNEYVQYVVRGALILLAVLINSINKPAVR